MKNALAARMVENPKLVTHVTAAKTVAYRKTSAQGVSTPVKKPLVSAPVSTVNNPTAYAAKITKNILAHVDNIMSKLKKNMMSLAKNVNQPRVTAT